MKNLLTKLLAALMASTFILSSCAGSANPDSIGSQNSPATDATQPSGMKVGAVLGEGGLGDQSFNDLVFAGLEKAKSELGVEFDYVEPKQISDFELFLREMSAEGDYAVIIAIGFAQVDALTTVAAEFPDQKFGFIDGIVEAPNVQSYTTADEQGSFLVGALAGLLKKEAGANQLNEKNTLGFVGALDIPLINKFRTGFEAGARYVNPDLTIRADYVGSFDDITTAKEISNTMNANGADIIYHAAGGAGLGVFQSAGEKNFMAIGVNDNQNHIDPEHIVASMLKRVDTITFEIIKSVCVDNQFNGGGIVEVGLIDNGIGYTTENSKIQVSKEIIDQVEAIRLDIISGKLTVPTKLEEVEGFLYANK